MFVPARDANAPHSREGGGGSGIGIEAVARRPGGDMMKLKPVRIGLWDQYGGSMTSGWLRWIFEQFEFPFAVVYPATLDQGAIASRFDVLVFPAARCRASRERLPAVRWRRWIPPT